MKNYSKEYPQFINEYSPLNIYSYNSREVKLGIKLLWWCNNNHLYEASLKDRLNGVNCYYCANKRLLENFNSLGATLPHLLKYWDYERNETSPYKVFSSKGRHYWICENKHSWLSRVTPQIRYSFNCPYCYGRYAIPGETDLATTMPKSLNVWDYEKNYPKTPRDFKKYSHAKVWWRCGEKNHSYEKTIAKWSASQNCPKCFGNSSIIEKTFGEDLRSIYGGEIITNSKSIIAPYEIDFYLPELKLAIEFNGEYWHGDEALLGHYGMTAVEYHSLKVKLCGMVGVRLLFVWEGDYNSSGGTLLEELDKIFIGDLDAIGIFDRLC